MAFSTGTNGGPEYVTLTITFPALTGSLGVGAAIVSDTPAGLGAATAADAEGDAETRTETPATAAEGDGEAIAMGDAAGLAATFGFGTADGDEVTIGGVVCVGAATGGAVGTHAVALTKSAAPRKDE